MKLLISFLIAFILSITELVGFDLDKFHVCTVATHSKHWHFPRLFQSCCQHGIKLEVLASGEPWWSYGSKLFYMLEYLETLPEDDIVLFVDAFDVLIIGDKTLLLKKFFDAKVPFLISAEANCFPHPELWNEFPNTGNKFRFPCTGAYIGYAGYLKSWLKNLDPPINVDKNDQGLVSLDYLKKKEFYHFDSNCDLFLSLGSVNGGEYTIDSDQGKVYYKVTNSFPLIIHGNGGSYSILNEVYDQLICKQFIETQPFIKKVINENINKKRTDFDLNRFLLEHGYDFFNAFSGMEPHITDAQRKQFNDELASHPEIQFIAEIGLNGGHSALNFFQNCKNLKCLTSFDINFHDYTQVVFQYFYENYNDSFEFIIGDSAIKIPIYAKNFPTKKFDLIYIDGCHSYEHCLNDILNCKKISHENTIVWVDDVNMASIKAAIETLESWGVIVRGKSYESFDSKWGGRYWMELRYQK